MVKSNQKGIAHILFLLLAAGGVLVYLLASQSLPFQKGLFSTLYPKKSSFASEPIPSPTPPSWCTACAADIDKDGTVTTTDIQRAAGGCWQKTASQTDVNGNSCSLTDLNKDGITDMTDVNCINSQWNNTCTLIPTPVPVPFTPPIRYWKMDDNVTGAGQTIKDSSGNNNYGTLYQINGISPSCNVPGVTGTACSFKGVDSFVGVTGGGGLNALNTGTISMWVKWNGTQKVDTCGNQYGSIIGRQYNARFSNNIISLSGSDPNTAKIVWNPYFACSRSIVGNTSVVNNIWHHVAITFRSGEHKLYVDGKLDGSSTTTGQMSNYANVLLTLGAWTGDGKGFSTSTMDEVKVYNYVLTADQVLQDMNQIVPPPPPTPTPAPNLSAVGYWKFDEGSGATAKNSGSTGSILDGTLVNNPTWSQGIIGGALYFNKIFGSNNYININDTGTFPLDLSGNSTISFWINPYYLPKNDYERMEILSKTDSSSAANYIVEFYTGGSFRFVYTANSNWRTFTFKQNTIPANQWTHVAFVFNWTDKKLTEYINGQVVEGQPIVYNLEPNNLAVKIAAAWYNNAPFQVYVGSLDEMRVYNYAQTQDQILNDVNQAAPPNCTPAPCPQPPPGCSYSGGTACSCGILVCTPPTPTPIPTPAPCILSSATWSTNSTFQGSSVGLNVQGNQTCAGVKVDFSVIRNGVLGGPANIQPASINLNVYGQGSGNWVAEYNPLIPLTNPQYYFTATSTTRGNTTVSSLDASSGLGILTVLPMVPPPSPPPPTPQPLSKRVFVTSTTYNGNLGGLAGADAKCQERANAANLGGNWKAWLSDDATSAATRLNHVNGSYKRLDGAIVANNWNDLTDGNLNGAINITELGVVKNISVWTNTAANGTGMGTINCSNWTSSTSTQGLAGVSYDSSSRWTYDSIAYWSCSSLLSLYCFEQ